MTELAGRAVGQRAGENLCVSGRLMSPAEALDVGFVDKVVPAGDVVASARRWCEHIIEAPAEALADTRSVLRRDLVEAIRSRKEEDTRRFAELWFQPPLQAAMRELVAQLKGD